MPSDLTAGLEGGPGLCVPLGSEVELKANLVGDIEFDLNCSSCKTSDNTVLSC